MKRRVVLSGLMSVVGLTALSPLALASDYDPAVLRVALLPDENAATVIQENERLQSYLEDRLGKTIELIVTTDYSSMIEAMRTGRIDIAYFGPASYTIAKDKMQGGDFDIQPFAARLKDGATTYQSVIITNADTHISSLEDIKGSGIEMAFGDKASTSSYFAPKYTLMQAGIMPGDDYNQRFLGDHDAVAVNVQRGNAQVGGLSRPIFESLIDKGMIDPQKVRVVTYSADIPQYPWVMRTDLKLGLQSQIKDAFLSLKKGTEEGDAVLTPFSSDGFAPISDSDYDIIRDIRASVQN